jgi:hypothetical protein
LTTTKCYTLISITKQSDSFKLCLSCPPEEPNKFGGDFARSAMDFKRALRMSLEAHRVL